VTLSADSPGRRARVDTGDGERVALDRADHLGGGLRVLAGIVRHAAEDLLAGARTREVVSLVVADDLSSFADMADSLT
jgi:hypothetical protein